MALNDTRAALCAMLNTPEQAALVTIEPGSEKWIGDRYVMFKAHVVGAAVPEQDDNWYRWKRTGPPTIADTPMDIGHTRSAFADLLDRFERHDDWTALALTDWAVAAGPAGRDMARMLLDVHGRPSFINPNLLNAWRDAVKTRDLTVEQPAGKPVSAFRMSTVNNYTSQREGRKEYRTVIGYVMPVRADLPAPPDVKLWEDQL